MKKRSKKEIIINEKKFFGFLLLWVLIFSIGLVVKPFQNDTFYTIKIGELITKNGIDMLDHFSFHNIMYTYPHWLYDVFIYLVYRVGGFPGIYISTIILNMILMYVVFYSSYKISKSYASSFVVTIITAIVMGHGFATARAQLVTYILFVLELYFIEMYINNKSKKYIIGLILISLLICNIHVAVWPFYYILFLPYLAEGIISNILSKTKKDNKFIRFLNNKFDIKKEVPVRNLILIMLGSTLTGLLTPIKDTPYTYLYKTMLGNSQKYIDEHRMVTFKESIFTIIIAGETLLLGLISKIKLRDLFLILGLSFMSIMSMRHIGLFTIVIPICFVRVYNYFIDLIKIEPDKLFYKFTSKKIVFALCFIILFVITGFNLKRELNDEYVIDSFYPIKAVNYIKENIDISKMRIFNEYNFGSYLLFNDIPVFIDSRADLYTKQFSGLDYDIFDDYVNINLKYEKYFDFYNITHVLVYKSRGLHLLLKSNKKYKLLYHDDNYYFYERVLDEEE